MPFGVNRQRVVLDTDGGDPETNARRDVVEGRLQAGAVVGETSEPACR